MLNDKKILQVCSAIEFIEDNLREPISVSDVCAVLPGSPWQFQRLFRLCTSDSIGNYIRLAQKLRLTEKQLDHNMKGIQREPQFVTYPAQNFVGLEIEIGSPFSEDLSYIEDVSNLWLRFNSLRHNIVGRKKAVGYGLVLSPSGTMFEDRFPYVASVAVDDITHELLPEGLRLYQLPEQSYAVFEKRGLADHTRLSLDYIYGYWLPQSGYRRAVGYDIEVFDQRLRLDRPESLSLYCIPVQTLL